MLEPVQVIHSPETDAHAPSRTCMGSLVYAIGAQPVLPILVPEMMLFIVRSGGFSEMLC